MTGGTFFEAADGDALQERLRRDRLAGRRRERAARADRVLHRRRRCAPAPRRGALDPLVRADAVTHDAKEVGDMEEKARQFNRSRCYRLASIFAAASIWAATALAAGGSPPSNEPAASNGPVAVHVQGHGDAAAPGNCPNDGIGSGRSSGGSSASAVRLEPLLTAGQGPGRRQRPGLLSSSEAALKPRSGSASTVGSSLSRKEPTCTPS